MVGIKHAQDGLQYSLAATVIRRGEHIYHGRLEVAFAVEFEALACKSTRKRGMTSCQAQTVHNVFGTAEQGS